MSIAKIFKSTSSTSSPLCIPLFLADSPHGQIVLGGRRMLRSVFMGLGVGKSFAHDMKLMSDNVDRPYGLH